MVQITFNSRTNHPTITLSVGDYHEDIDPTSRDWVDWANTLAFGRSPLNQYQHAMRVAGAHAASRDDFSLTEYAQQFDDALEAELQVLKEQYEQARKNAEIIISDPVTLEEHLEQLRYDYERAVKNEVALANANLQGAYAVDAIDHINAENYDPTDHCFPAGTPIQMWPLDPSVKPRADGSYDEARVRSKLWTKPIQDVRDGDITLSFDDAGRLQPGKVVRLYGNATDCFIRLEYPDGRAPLHVTPGHPFLDETGGFTKIGDLLRLGGNTARLIDVSGAVVTVTGTWLHYSAETAYLFERASTKSMVVNGNTVFKEAVKEGWMI